MSCIFVLALGQVGVLCSDTRISIQDDTEQLRNDEGHVHIRSNVGAFEIPDSGRKIRFFHFGWGTAVGCWPLIDQCFSALQSAAPQNPAQAKEVLRETYDRQAPVIRQWWKGPGEHMERTTFLFVYPCSTANELRLESFRFEGDQRSEGNYYLATPPGFHRKGSLVHRLGLQGSVSPGDLIIRLSRLFHEVHLASDTVSDRLEVVFVQSTQGNLQSRRLLADNQLILSLTPAQVEAKLGQSG